jgi:uncharacterized protein YoxC
MLDSKKTPEIQPITCVQETIPEQNTLTQKLDTVDEKVLALFASLESLHEKVQELGTRTHETTTSIERLHGKVQELSTRTHKTAASIEQWQQNMYELTVRAQKPEPELSQSDLEVDQEIEDRISRLSHVESELVQEHRPEPEPESESEPESEPEPEPELEQTPLPAPRTKASTRGRNRLSLCMMPSDEMQDVILAISPDKVSEPASPFEPAPSPANLLEQQPDETSPTSVADNTAESYVLRIRDEAELVAQVQ